MVALLFVFILGVFVGGLLSGGWYVLRRLRRYIITSLSKSRSARTRRRHNNLAQSSNEFIKNNLAGFQRPVRTPLSLYRFTIQQIEFSTGLSLVPTRITVFVGPNNSGKSFALKALHSALTGASGNPVYSDVTVSIPATMAEFHDSYDAHLDVSPYSLSGSYRFSDELLNDEPTLQSLEVDAELDKSFIRENAVPGVSFLKALGPLFVNRVSTEDRIVASSTKDRAAAAGLLSSLYFAGRDTEQTLSNIVYSTFGVRTRLDDSTPAEWSIRISDNFENIPFDAMEARRQLGRLSKLEWQGDGLRSFVTVVINLLVGKRPILLIDEPEAFLHPAQAFVLGQLLGNSEPSGGNQFIATHSAHLLRGILNGVLGASDITLLRLTRDGNSFNQSILDSQYFSTIVNDPLLGSGGFVEGLFYPGVLIFEGNSDRVLLELMSRRTHRLDGMLFLAGVGSASAVRIHAAYARLSIPSVVLLDCDLLLEGDVLLESVVSLSRSTTFRTQVSKLRIDVIADVKDREELKKYGRRALSNRAAEKFDELQNLLNTIGIVINPTGELEGSLAEAELNYSTDKKRWIENAVRFVASDSPDFSRYPWRLLRTLEEAMNAITQRYSA